MKKVIIVAVVLILGVSAGIALTMQPETENNNQTQDSKSNEPSEPKFITEFDELTEFSTNLWGDSKPNKVVNSGIWTYVTVSGVEFEATGDAGIIDQLELTFDLDQSNSTKAFNQTLAVSEMLGTFDVILTTDMATPLNALDVLGGQNQNIYQSKEGINVDEGWICDFNYSANTEDSILCVKE